ncbi:CPBP family intramembrane glutamic endopeptidase [Kordiimonas laminariae]|uniref:CPBP family intramembrane glutamic endopeptidase n=1 Tax=Kordiimonas laminariae TaxID=2917717 RepID=UPI001FF44D0D|nr:CPBP family intramembrane metalloprotease [Kordiimonas laminariae]
MISSIAGITASILSLLFIPKLFGNMGIDQDITKAILRYFIAITIIITLFKLNWLRDAWFTKPTGRQFRYWLLAIIPTALVCSLNLASFDFSTLEFSTTSIAGWILGNFSTGLFEETLLRGFCFFLLFNAWADTRSGLFKAALVQAGIFGILHFLNLTEAPLVDTGAQVIYATIFGICFAGIAAYTRNIWIPIIAHTLINASGSINSFFLPGYEQSAGDIGGYAVAVIIIFIACGLPGIYCLKKADLKAT